MSEQAELDGVETAGPDVLDPVVEPIMTEVVEYSELLAGLNEMQKLRGMAYDLATTRGNDAARKDRKKLVSSRTWLDKRRIELNAADRASIAARINLRDSEAARLTELIKSLELPISQQIAADEQRREDKRIADLRAEEARVAALRERINDISNVAVRAVGLSSADIDAKIALVTRIEIDDSFEDVQAVAGNAKFECLLKLKELHAAALVAEAAAAEAERTRARLAELEAQEAARVKREAVEQAERDRAAAVAAEAERKAAAARQLQSATANDLVDEIRRVQRRAFSASSAGMLELVGLVEAIVIGDELGDFAGVAQKAKDDALVDLHEMHAAVVQREAEKRSADAQASLVREIQAETQRHLDESLAVVARQQAEVAERQRVIDAAAEAAKPAPEPVITSVLIEVTATPSMSRDTELQQGIKPGAPLVAEGWPVNDVPPTDSITVIGYWDEASTPNDAPLTDAEAIDELHLKLINCRAALTEALELLEGWIAYKCVKKHVPEHMAKVAELRALGGLPEVAA